MPVDAGTNGETSNAGVWTGTDITGLRLPNTQHCSDWTYNDTDQTGSWRWCCSGAGR